MLKILKISIMLRKFRIFAVFKHDISMANKVIKIKDLIQDDHNFNRGNERGQELIVKSFKEFGAGRSVLVDKNNRLIGGNKAQLGAIDAGLEDAIIVDTTGDKLVVVRRNDIDLDSEKGRKMALADNATQQANLEWNEDEINAAKDTWNVHPEEWDVKTEQDGGIPLELQGEDLLPDALDNVQGEDRTEMQRVILVYYQDQEERVKEMLHLESIDKVVYNVSELPQ